MAFNLDGVLASTLPNINKKFQDNLSTKTPFMFKLKEQGGMNMVDGGTVLRFPVILGKGIAGSYYGDDPLDVSRPGGITYLEFDWKQYFSSVTIVGIEEIQNAGQEQAVKLLDGRMQQAEVTTIENFESMLFDPTGGGNGGKDWTSLPQIVADDPTTGTIGKQSRAANAQLRNQVNSTAVSAFNTSQNGRSALTSLWLSCTNGMRSPNFIVTTPAIWQLYQLSLTANERFVMESEADKSLRSAGFLTQAFMTAPVTFSAQCPASHLYMLRIKQPNSDGGIFLSVSKTRNFKMMDFIRPINQDVRTSLVLTAGELCCDAPYLQGVATNITG